LNLYPYLFVAGVAREHQGGDFQMPEFVICKDFKIRQWPEKPKCVKNVIFAIILIYWKREK